MREAAAAWTFVSKKCQREQLELRYFVSNNSSRQLLGSKLDLFSFKMFQDVSSCCWGLVYVSGKSQSGKTRLSGEHVRQCFVPGMTTRNEQMRGMGSTSLAMFFFVRCICFREAIDFSWGQSWWFKETNYIAKEVRIKFKYQEITSKLNNNQQGQSFPFWAELESCHMSKPLIQQPRFALHDHARRPLVMDLWR